MVGWVSVLAIVAASCVSARVENDQENLRCPFHKGAHVEETLGITPAKRAAIPITHVVVVMQENRSYDHLLGQLANHGQTDAEPISYDFVNYDNAGRAVHPFALTSPVLESDPPHQWQAVHNAWNDGKMDGFVRAAATESSNGHYVMGYYPADEVPFYYWLANTFAISDRHFSSVLAGTWPNRNFLYAANSHRITDSTAGALVGEETIFDVLDRARISWRVYVDGTPRQAQLGWDSAHRGVYPVGQFFIDVAAGALPAVVFIDPTNEADEHPPNHVSGGEELMRNIYLRCAVSPLWKKMVVFFTYDEAGGLADHVPPPRACPPDGTDQRFDHMGIRVPFIAISPWAKPHYVSHIPTEHTSILRFIELLHDLPALTRRDANASALLDLFDFSGAPPGLLSPGTPPFAEPIAEAAE